LEISSDSEDFEKAKNTSVKRNPEQKEKKMVPFIEESSDSDDVERAKEELEHWHKKRKINIKENENRKRKEVKMFDRANYEAKLSKRNPERQKPAKEARSMGK
jgi:hypothetical protein